MTSFTWQPTLISCNCAASAREVALEISGLTQVRIDELLDPKKQSGPAVA